MPSLFLNLLLFAGGIVGLFWGAEWLVRGAGRMARGLGVSALVVGLTVVAFGTSVPELAVGVIAAMEGSPHLALGNVVGSNVMNIALILGISSLLSPIHVETSVIRREIPVMIALTILTGLLGVNAVLGRVDAIVLMVLFVVYLGMILVSARREPEAVERSYRELGHPSEGDPSQRGIAMCITMVTLGILVMALGARGVVSASVFFARAWGMSELVIGLTVVAVGTSLPELATSLVAAYRGKPDIAVGNIVGSNVFNLCAILGATALIAPIPFPEQVLKVEYMVMLVISFLLLPLAMTHNALSRRDGGLLLAAYVGFTIMVVLRAG